MKAGKMMVIHVDHVDGDFNTVMALKNPDYMS